MSLPVRVPDPTGRLEPIANEVAALMVSPIPGTFGQGYPGLLYISTITYLAEQDRPAAARTPDSQMFFSEILHAHETAHQWWGNTVTTAATQDEWLMEALANYSALLVLEKRKGPRAVAAMLDEYKRQLTTKNPEGQEIESIGPVQLGTRLQSSLSPGAWRTIVYGKGTWIIHMLRARLGDESFFQLLAEVCRKYRNRAVTVDIFREMAASYLPKGAPDPKLDLFFEQWVEGTGVPTITMTSSLKGKLPQFKLTLTAKQTGLNEQMALAVPVDVQISRAKTETHWVMTGPENALTLNLKTAPLKVTLDPGNLVLRR